MTVEKRDLAASVLARLLNHAKKTGDDYQVVLTSFCLERFLYRLGVSEVRAFARRAGVLLPGDPGRELAGPLAEFLLPILEDLRRGGGPDGRWSPGGPWREGKPRQDGDGRAHRSP